MDVKEILRRVDHTLLAQGATWDEIRQICDDGMKYGCASVCIPQSYVRRASAYIAEHWREQGSWLPVCTVIGFPNGYSPTEIKCVEAENAVLDGAGEIDMVVNLGWVKDGLYEQVEDEINAVKDACDGRLLKVIIETCLLTEEEKIKLCAVVSRSDADYIKTSTGFAGGGATREDVKLMVEHCKGKRVKASGGIADLKDAEDFIALGAERLGTSRIVKAVKALKNG
ncbi:MAG: deoxyribose-phosphate aldolase [Oscillospiraceae bacterium]|nr:deoxyribose-phosphate aldolase [Oscillospiraceae bacterium]